MKVCGICLMLSVICKNEKGGIQINNIKIISISIFNASVNSLF